MTSEDARLVLIEKNFSITSEKLTRGSEWVDITVGERAELDGTFGLEELEAIIQWMKDSEGVNKG
jgi:hypothetical protein